MKKNPEQTYRTKKKLADAFWELYEIKPYEQITVREVTELAGYNRSTFYTYYKDVYDILEQAEEEILSMLKEGIPHKGHAVNKHMLTESIRFLGAFLKKNHKRMSLLLGVKGDAKFLHHMLYEMRESMRSNFQHISKTDDKSLEYVIEYVLNANIGLTLRWFQNGCDISFEEVVTLIHKLTLGGFMSVLTNDSDYAEEVRRYFAQQEKVK